MSALSMSERSVKRYSSCRLLGIRMVRNAALHSARRLLSLASTTMSRVTKQGVLHAASLIDAQVGNDSHATPSISVQRRAAEAQGSAAHPEEGCAACSPWKAANVRAIHLSSAWAAAPPGSRPAAAVAVRGTAATLVALAAVARCRRLIGGSGRCKFLPQL